LTDRSASAPKKSRWRSSLVLVAISSALNLCLAASLWGETLKVAQPHERLYQSPDFNSLALGPVPQGEAVRVLQKSGSWFQVEHQGKVGWLHRKAFPWSPQAPSGQQASPLRPVPPGTGQSGWVPQTSGEVRPPTPSGPLGHPGLIQGKPVQGVRSDEIATGGKAVPPPAKSRKPSRPKRPPARKLHKTNPQGKPTLPQPQGAPVEAKF
jgi:hypothetical protein